MTAPLGLLLSLFLLARPSPPADPVLAIQNASVFDPITEKMNPNRTVLIRGDKITSVIGPEATLDLPPNAVIVDGRGKFLIPGLIDAHVHLVHILDYSQMTGDEVLPLYLAAGVTSIRSTGDEISAATLVARAAESKRESSPRVFTCSGLLDRDPPIHRDVGRAVTDPAQVPSVVDEYVRWKVTTLKIYAGTKREVGRAIIEEGHRRGLFVTAHLGAYSAQDAVADGVDGLEHIESVFNYVIPPDMEKKAGYRGRVDLNHPMADALTAELAKRRTFVDPTLAVFRNMILLSDVPEVEDHPDNALSPARLRAFWPVYLKRTGCPHGGALEDRRKQFGKYLELTGKLYKAGVPILVGTDSPEPQVTPGFSLHQELEMMVEAGLPPSAALKAATWNNATALKREKSLGSIEPGKLADIVILTADPLADIKNTRKIETVIRGGLVAKPADLLRLVPKE